MLSLLDLLAVFLSYFDQTNSETPPNKNKNKNLIFGGDSVAISI